MFFLILGYYGLLLCADVMEVGFEGFGKGRDRLEHVASTISPDSPVLHPSV